MADSQRQCLHVVQSATELTKSQKLYIYLSVSHCAPCHNEALYILQSMEIPPGVTYSLLRLCYSGKRAADLINGLKGPRREGKSDPCNFMKPLRHIHVGTRVHTLDEDAWLGLFTVMEMRQGGCVWREM